MKYIEDYFRVLAEEQLQEAFLEYEEWRETGVLKQGILREINKQYKDEKGVDLRVDGMIEPMLYEIAKKHYKR